MGPGSAPADRELLLDRCIMGRHPRCSSFRIYLESQQSHEKWNNIWYQCTIEVFVKSTKNYGSHQTFFVDLFVDVDNYALR